MARFAVLFALAFALTGCLDGTNPFMEEDTSTTTTTTTDDTTTDDTTTDDTTTSTETTTTTTTTPTVDTTDPATVTTDTGTAIETDTNRLPGTVNPSSASSIFRTEDRSAEDDGVGYAEGFAYDSESDTFTVDNLAFDGDRPYTVVLDENDNRLGIGPFTVFQAPSTAADTLTSESVNQFSYRAL